MNFLSPSYALLLAIAAIVFWSSPTRPARQVVILLASLLFFGLRQPLYVPLLLAGVLVNFWWGLSLGPPPDDRVVLHYGPGSSPLRQKQRRRRLAWAIGLNVLLLFGFKYIPFTLETLGWAFRLPAWLGAAGWFEKNIAIPLGLSFFCFECIAYVVDVYRGAPPALSFLEFATYKLFFPKLVSGPIVRYHALAQRLKTLDRPVRPDPLTIVEALWLIGSGAFKKGAIADYLGQWVNLVLGGGLQRAGSLDLALAIAAYSLQIYLDFSGYVDLARGSALLLGIDLPQNFNFPYFSTSLAEFWRRWHISLGDWLRNYLYIPLGGSRQGLWRTCANLCIVMLLGGLWHGADWGFVVWGGLHGLALALHRLTDALSKQWAWLEAFWSTIAGAFLGWSLTIATVLFSWIFFRLPDLHQSATLVQHLVNYPADPEFLTQIYEEALRLERSQLAGSLLLITLAMTLAWVGQRWLRLDLAWRVKAILAPLALFWVWAIGPEGIPFIYFAF